MKGFFIKREFEAEGIQKQLKSEGNHIWWVLNLKGLKSVNVQICIDRLKFEGIQIWKDSNLKGLKSDVIQIWCDSNP